MSQRYVNFHKGIKAFVTPPSFKERPEVLARWETLQKDMLSFYDFCTESGIRQEDARFALPMGTVSREQFSMGFQAMQQFLDVRMCERAQWEIREMAWQIYGLMKKAYPQFAKRLGIKCWENRGLACDEDIAAFEACKWSRSRPHKDQLTALWKASRKSTDLEDQPI